MNNPFSALAASVTIAATNASGSGALPGTPGAADVVRVVNASTSAIAYVRFTTGASTAVLTDTPVAPLSAAHFSLPPSVDTVSVILDAAGPANVAFQRGNGSV